MSFGGVIYRVVVWLDRSLPAGIAGLTVGLPGEPWATLPDWYTPRPAGPWTVAEEGGP
jgi:hypothetical protein